MRNEINIAIDADSLCFKACYRHQWIESEGVDIELAYLEFCGEIQKIKSAVFRLLEYKSGDVVIPKIVLSPKKTFRNDLSDEYKANRGPVLIHGIKQLKLMIMHRLKPWAMVVPDVEADDVVIHYANKYNWLVSAIDKDVIHACPTSCYDYNKRRWEQPNMPYEIETWYAKQALMGDKDDNIKGAPDIGGVNAQKWVNNYVGELFDWNSYCDMFGSEEEATRTMNLIRMDGLIEIDGKLVWKPWEPYNNNYWEL